MWPDFISRRAYYTHFGSVRSYVEVKGTNKFVNLAFVHRPRHTAESCVLSECPNGEDPTLLKVTTVMD